MHKNTIFSINEVQAVTLTDGEETYLGNNKYTMKYLCYNERHELFHYTEVIQNVPNLSNPVVKETHTSAVINDDVYIPQYDALFDTDYDEPEYIHEGDMDPYYD